MSNDIAEPGSWLCCVRLWCAAFVFPVAQALQVICINGIVVGKVGMSFRDTASCMRMRLEFFLA